MLSYQEKPLVSICCLAYNHAQYIRQCLEGFVLQKTNFLFEILIHDDCSTDGTADVIREYEEKYPTIIKPIYQTKNQYSQGVKINRTYQYPRAQGKYIALCEGDDYWIDPLKLQKQVDFLEANSDYGLSYTNYNIWIESSKRIMENKKNREGDSGDVYKALLFANFIPSLTVCFRKELLNEIDDSYILQQFKMGDYPLWLEMSRITKFKCLDDVTSVYRLLNNSASHSSDIKKVVMFNEKELSVRTYFVNKYGTDVSIKKLEYITYTRLIKKMFGFPRREFFMELYCAVKACPILLLNYKVLVIIFYKILKG